MFGLKKLRIGYRVGKDNNNHIKVQGVLMQYAYKGDISSDAYSDHVWLVLTVLERDEKQLYRDVEVMKMLGIDIRG